jgi:hypothetical protein
MKTFKEFLEEVEAEQRYLIVIMPESLISTEILTEQWIEAGISDIVYRVDAANSSTKGERHVHIAHKRHRRVKGKQVSWNQSGTRHDKKTFDKAFKPLAPAKDVARRVLGIPDSTILEHVSSAEQVQLLVESALYEGDVPEEAVILRVRG